MPGTESCSQQVETFSGKLHCQVSTSLNLITNYIDILLKDVDVLIAPAPCLEQIKSGAILGQGYLYKEPTYDNQRTSISDGISSRSYSGDSEARHEQLRYYESVLRGQRLQLYDQAEKLVEKLMSLLDTGVLLGIMPSNPHLLHLLASAHADIQSRGKMELGG
ncbi:hypothetical protein N7516_010459 [Penicillium verrucosum]|uniref:uncharacterized protein n=1 Tax=Penicillium verrucosum TaxID=60171 RepID=UPI0025453E08|nr:uncharacterized protein N7516_010459 [Penicillium verrucosum]KAJ5922756.1 hypothetical protein N7516_010459 [Penicillium verrucosum]